MSVGSVSWQRRRGSEGRGLRLGVGGERRREAEAD